MVLCAAVAAATVVSADGPDRIEAEVADTNRGLSEECGCTLSFSGWRAMDFTTSYGSSLAFNVEKDIEGIGDEARSFCRNGDAHKQKFCTSVRTVTFHTTTLANPYAEAAQDHTVRSYISIANTNQLMNGGGNWVRPYMEDGRMPNRN
jgi:hypothetical protein